MIEGLLMVKFDIEVFHHMVKEDFRVLSAIRATFTETSLCRKMIMMIKM